MGSGTKRAADDSTSPRGSKAQKTEKNSDPKSKGKKAAKKTQPPPPLSITEFKSKALPLHVNLTHTPPSIEKVESDIAVASGSELEDVAKVDAVVVEDDVGFIENLTLLPTSFTTGSYGWKGSKRITVELQGGDGEGESGKEKVQVMLSINATVIGSKPGGKTGKGSLEAKKEDLAEEPENDDE